MTTQTSSPQKDAKLNITACIDGAEMTDAIIDASVWASHTLSAPLKFLHVIERAMTPTSDRSGAILPGTADHLLDELTELDEKRGKVALEIGKHMLASARERATSAGIDQVSLQQRHGGIIEAMITTEPDTRVFVVGRLGDSHDVSAPKLGAHLESLVRSISTPVIVAVGAFSPPRSFMVAYDGSETAEKAIAELAASSLLKGQSGHVVMIGPDNEKNRSDLQRATELLAAGGHAVDGHLRQGNVVTELHAFREERNIGLIVMGAYGHSRVRDFFVGSNTSKMIVSSPVPLLLLR